MSGMVRATERGWTCVDCGSELGQHEALLCQRCDAAEIRELRAMHAPSPERCGIDVVGGLKCTREAGHEDAPRSCEWIMRTGSSGVGICRKDSIKTTPIVLPPRST